MKKIDLYKFCSDSRSDLERPWSVGKWTYATDARILIRVPSSNHMFAKGGIDAVLSKKKFKFDHDSLKRRWKRPTAEMSGIRATKCENCQGTASFYCGECGTKRKCDECYDGKGVFRPRHGVNFGKARIARRYAHLICTLPNVQIWDDPNYTIQGDSVDNGRLRIRFDGGLGYVMCLRTSP